MGRVRAGSPQFYKRRAKPRNTLPNRTAMLVAAPGTNVPEAAPPWLPPAAAVWVAPPKPVTGILFVAEPVGACVEDIVLRREELPRKGDCAPQGWSWLLRQLALGVGPWGLRGATYVHAAWHVLSPLQLLLHCWPHAWHMKKGRVCEYWVMLGTTPFSQMQVYVS
jgi:hypothetical protein